MAQIPASATAVTLMAANGNRKMGIVHNNSTDILYVKLGPDASLTDYAYRLVSMATLELPIHDDGKVYNGIVTGIWSGTNGNAYVTEYGQNPAVPR